ncbi:MAG: DUF6062 family protein [Eisenbergiella massiliensis]
MKEKLYTIPLNDAMNAEDECPFCFIERNVEQDIRLCSRLLRFLYGKRYQEATDKAGFCRMHYKKMFDYGNTLGNGWILKTHYKKLIAEMKDQFSHFTPANLLMDKRRRGRGCQPIASWSCGKGKNLLYL